MKRPHNRQRLAAMHQMLFEMAGGNFNVQIPLSSHDDELETLVVLLNMMAEELKESVLFSGYVNPHSAHLLVAAATFILDDAHTIVNASTGALGMLGYGAGEMLGKPVTDFISGGMQAFLALIDEAPAGENRKQGRAGTLHFVAASRLLVAADCSIERLADAEGWVLSFLAPYLRDPALPAGIPEGGKAERLPNSRRSDARLIQKVYDYILGHLHEPLPSLKELARQFGTNEFKLKEGFRHFFGTSIYNFYTDERLKRAYLMIEQTDMPLKNIALLNGYNSYPNFSKSFRKHFGFPPNALQRGGDTR